MKKLLLSSVVLATGLIAWGNTLAKTQDQVFVPVPMENVKEAPESLKQLMHERSLKMRKTPTLPAQSSEDLDGSYIMTFNTHTGRTTRPDTMATYDPGQTKEVTIVATGDSTVRVTNMFGLPLTAKMQLDGSYKINRDQKNYYTTTYGTISLKAIFYFAGNDLIQPGWYYTDLYFICDGENGIEFDEGVYVYSVIDAGQYANYLYGPYYALLSMTPNPARNGLMTYDYNAGDGVTRTYDYGVSISEDEDFRVSVNNFGGFDLLYSGAENTTVVFDLAADRTFTVPVAQSLFSQGTNNYKLYLYSNNAPNQDTPIAGVGDENLLMSSDAWTGYDIDTRYWTGMRTGVTLKYVDGSKFEYPVAPPTSLTLNHTDEEEIVLEPEQTLQLEVVEVDPEYASKEVIWNSSDDNVASVDENGLVTAVGIAPQAVIVGGNRTPVAPEGKQLLPVTITATSAVIDATASASVKLYVVVDDSTVGVTDINPDQAKSVKYVNAQGMVSDQPFDGMNIQVITLTNGTVKTVKVVK